MCSWSWFSFTLTSVQRCMIATVLWSVQHARFLPFFSFSLPSHENCWINKSFHSYLFICYRETKLMSSSVKPNSSKVWTFVVCQTSDQCPWLPITAQKDFSPKILVSSQRAEDARFSLFCRKKSVYARLGRGSRSRRPVHSAGKVISKQTQLCHGGAVWRARCRTHTRDTHMEE